MSQLQTNGGIDCGRLRIDYVLALLLEDVLFGFARRRRPVDRNLEVRKVRLYPQHFDALGRDGQAEPNRALKSVGLEIDTNHRARLQILRHRHSSNHKISADIPDPRIVLGLISIKPVPTRCG